MYARCESGRREEAQATVYQNTGACEVEIRSISADACPVLEG